MRLHRIGAIMLRHAYEMRRNFDRMVDIVYWPILDLVVWGFITLYLTQTEVAGSALVSFLLGAVILWGIFYAFQRDLAMGFLEELWSRNLISLFSTPLTVREYLLGLISLNVIKVVVIFTVTSLLALLFYTFNIFPFLIYFLPYVLNLLLFGLALGIIINGLIVRYSTRIQTLAWSFAGLLQPVSCVFYPLSSLPPFLQSIAWFLPTTHAFEGLRQILSGGGFSLE